MDIWEKTKKVWGGGKGSGLVCVGNMNIGGLGSDIPSGTIC